MEPSSTAAPTFDDEEVRLLLAGSEEDVRQALSLMEQKLRLPALGWAKHKCPWLRSPDLPGLWSQVLHEFYKKVVRDKASGKFDLNKPIMPLLCTILHRRGIDVLRIRLREEKRAEKHEEFLRAAGKALKDTEVGQKWKSEPDERRQTLNQAILAAIATLPDKQRIVCGVYFGEFNGAIEMVALCDKVAKVTGKPETLVAVKRSLQEGRIKVREYLQRRGFKCGGHEEP